jgi:hypothetical protein
VGNDTVAVHLSNGEGEVQTTTYERFDPPGQDHRYSDVAVVDGDDDGDIDLAVADFDWQLWTADIALWLNDGTGVLGDRVPFGGGPHYVREMAVGDVDGDGADDLVAADEWATRVTIGGPSPAIVELPTSGAYTVELVDVDADGLDEMVIGRPRAPTQPAPTYYGVAVYRSTGVGFAAPVEYELPVLHGGAPTSVRAGDVNGDGAQDLVVGLSGSGMLAVVPGLGDGTFGPEELADEWTLPSVADVELADFDTDGFLDAIVRGRLVMFGDGTGGFAAVHSVLADGDSAVLDLDGDGVMDVATASPVLYLYLNRLDGARDHD